MSSTENTAKVCSSIKDANLKNECEATAKACADDSCHSAIDHCATNDSWPSSLVTDKSEYEVKNPYLCMMMVKILSGKGHKFVSPLGKDPSFEKQEAATSESQSPAPAAPEEAEDEQQVEATAGHTPPSAEAKAQHAENCDSLEGEGKQGACAEISALCASNSSWPLTIETTGGYVEAKNEYLCMMLAQIVAGKGSVLGEPVAKDAKAAKPPEEAGSSEAPDAPPPPDDQAGEEDDGIYLTKPFSDSNLRLKVTGGNSVEVRRTLHFEGGKGIPIKMSYSVEALSDDSYLMKYSISKGKEPIDEDQSIEFKAPGGEINLGFKIGLYDEGDFGSIKSIEVVELD